MKRQAVHAHPRRHGGAWRTAAALLGLALLVAAGAAAAQTVYKWKDAQGKLHYADTPPPTGARVLKTAGQPSPDTSALPYELARAVRNHPVTLYTTSAAPCDACEQGRVLLRTRGVPYTEKTVDNGDDQAMQRRLTGKDALPLLVVGQRQVAGYQAAGWQDALDTASYPRTPMLPSGYRNAAPQPASADTPAGAAGAPVRAQVKPPADAAAAQPAAKPSAPQNPDVPSIRF